MSIQENVSHLEELLANAKALLAKATEFDAGYYPVLPNWGGGAVYALADELVAKDVKLSSSDRVLISWRGKDSWAICHGHNCLGKHGEWEYEPSPSNRDEEWLEDFRFNSVDAAFRFYEEWKVAEIKKFKEGVAS